MRKAGNFLAVLIVVTAGAYVHAERFSRLNSWELTFKSRPPHVLEVAEPDGLKQYTYIIYEISNPTDSPIDFYGTFEIETPSGTVTQASVKPLIFTRIAGHRVVELLPFREMVGTIAPGETKRGVAIFEGVDPAADLLTVYVGGLTADNVSAAVRQVQPFAVDVASGVEAAPGRKDHDLVRAFVEAAKRASKSR